MHKQLKNKKVSWKNYNYSAYPLYCDGFMQKKKIYILRKLHKKWRLTTKYLFSSYLGITFKDVLEQGCQTHFALWITELAVNNFNYKFNPQDTLKQKK